MIFFSQKYLYIISDKGLVSRIYKELSNLNNNEVNYPVKNWSKDLNFTKENTDGK